MLRYTVSSSAHDTQSTACEPATPSTVNAQTMNADKGMGAGSSIIIIIIIAHEVRCGRVLREGTRALEAVNHAHGTVQPAAARLRVGVRADEQRRPGFARAPEHVADPVDGRLQPRLLVPLAQPAPRCHVRVGESGAHLATPRGGRRSENVPHIQDSWQKEPVQVLWHGSRAIEQRNHAPHPLGGRSRGCVRIRTRAGGEGRRAAVRRRRVASCWR
jgi:hypothetical protein